MNLTPTNIHLHNNTFQTKKTKQMCVHQYQGQVLAGKLLRKCFVYAKIFMENTLELLLSKGDQKHE